MQPIMVAEKKKLRPGPGHGIIAVCATIFLSQFYA